MSLHEWYPTPAACVRELLRHHTILGRCCEPCVGDGSIVHAVGGGCTWRTMDIDPRWPATLHGDASLPQTWARLSQNKQFDWVITNPPFSLARPILEHALRHSHSVALYVRMSFNEPLRGAERWQATLPAPESIIFLPRVAHCRSPKTGKWATDSVACCWMVWDVREPDPAIYYAGSQCIEDLDTEREAYRALVDRYTR